MRGASSAIFIDENSRQPAILLLRRLPDYYSYWLGIILPPERGFLLKGSEIHENQRLTKKQSLNGSYGSTCEILAVSISRPICPQ